MIYKVENIKLKQKLLFHFIVIFFIAILLRVMGKETYWIDTILSFPFGMLLKLKEDSLLLLFEKYKNKILIWLYSVT